MHEDLDIASRLLKRVSVPNHSIRSWGLLAKRERISDDKVLRAMSRCADLVGGDLTHTSDNRIAPTPLGSQFLDLVERLLNLGKSQADQVEVVRVGIAPGLDASAIFAPAIARFMAAWGGAVTVQVVTVPEGVREAVRSKAVAFGLDWADGDSTGVDERLQPVPVSALIPNNGHRLAGLSGPLDADHLAETDRVFFAPRMAASLRALLVRVPLAHRVEIGCPTTLHRLAATGVGLACEYAHPVRRSGEPFVRLAVVGAEPSSLGLCLPPGDPSRSMTDPAQYLASALREAAREACEKTTPAGEIPEVGLPIPERLSA
jgi:hypothetical protein